MKTKYQYRFCPLYLLKTKKRVTSIISIILMVAFLNLTTGCSYYNVNQVPKTDVAISENINQFNKAYRYVIVHSGGHSYHLNSLKLDEENRTISGTITALNFLHIESQFRDIKKTHRYNSSKYNPLDEVHFYLDNELVLVEGENIRIPFSNIASISVNDKNTGKSVWMTALAVTGYTVGILVIVGAIVLATKSSCPFIYAKNGDDFVFIGELYPGAIFSNIQRDDYIPLQGIKPIDNEYIIKITNELLEIQHTDLAQLIVVDHPEAIEVLLDDKGSLQTFSSINTPEKAVLDNNKSLLDPALKKDNIGYTFNTDIDDQNSIRSIIFEFDKPSGAMKGKLYLTAKNSMWLDYVYGKFNEQFGSYYSKFQKDQESVSKEKKMKWMNEQNIPLSIYKNTSNGWELANKINTVGPLASRNLVVPIDLSNVIGNKLQIKLETGFMFWEVDYVGMDYSENIPLKITYIDPTNAFDENNNDVAALLTKTDEKYLVQPEVGNEVIITYSSDALDATVNQSVFLKNRGYYTYIRDYDGIPDFDYLRSFREAGAFTKFSEEVYNMFIDSPMKDEISLNNE